MAEKPIILGIETSCDETAVSIIKDNDNGVPEILSNIISSQFDVHKEFGGVVPELAARSHVEKIDLIVKKAIKDSGVSLNSISAISATCVFVISADNFNVSFFSIRVVISLILWLCSSLFSDIICYFNKITNR